MAGLGLSIGRVVAQNPDKVSLSTLKAIEAGRHIRPEQLKAVRNLYGIERLAWVETKITYAEHYLQALLAPPLEELQGNPAEDDHVTGFFRLRGKRTREVRSADLQRMRLQVEVAKALTQAGTTAAAICAHTGPSPDKKDRSRVSYPTVTAFERGENIRPAKFNAICRALKLQESAQHPLRIAYAEAYLGEFLLGTDATIFSRTQSLHRYPRAMSLLIFSTQNSADLA